MTFFTFTFVNILYHLILTISEEGGACKYYLKLILEKGLRWDVSGTYRGVSGVWELVVDFSTNTIVHFNFVSN